MKSHECEGVFCLLLKAQAEEFDGIMKTKDALPELREVEQLTRDFPSLLGLEKLGEVGHEEHCYPVYGLKLGSNDPQAPVFGLFAGVHGLERVGTHVLLAFLRSLLSRWRWDKDWQRFFSETRLVSIPIINPIGMALARRSNGNHVDLMRNSPLEASGKLIPLVSGHRQGPHLPWYRGKEGTLEPEVEMLERFCREQFFASKQVITLDLHSGFGLRDRLWYPWSTRSSPFPNEQQVLKLKVLLEEMNPYHVYIVEHQSLNYSNHGDLWDWLFESYQGCVPDGRYLPLTLEMGSWLWVKKNPWQIFSREGLFNPVKKHRYARTMRRHLQILEFFLKATRYHENWSSL